MLPLGVPAVEFASSSSKASRPGTHVFTTVRTLRREWETRILIASIYMIIREIVIEMIVHVMLNAGK